MTSHNQKAYWFSYWFVVTIIGGGLELRSLAAVGSRHQHHFTAPTERTPSRGSASDAHPAVATMFGGGLEGFGAPRSRAAPSPDGAHALQGVGPPCPSDRGNLARARPV